MEESQNHHQVQQEDAVKEVWIDNFIAVHACLVAWLLNEGVAGGDLVLIESFLLLISYVYVAVLMLISNNYLH